MVAIKKKLIYHSDGTIDVPSWLKNIGEHYDLKSTDLLVKACQLADESSKGLTTFYGQPCVEQGLEMAEILLDLKLDQESVAAAIISSSAQHTRLSIETITEKLGENVAKLVQGFLQLNAINILASSGKDRDTTQIDRLRKILLAMVSDIRVVLIKLAERTAIMRGIKKINPIERKHIAQETMDIFAPLANRLGIGQLKWELEDLAFHYIDPDSYKKIAEFLAERRDDRVQRIHSIISTLKEELLKKNIKSSVTGRAKHIYSIYLKMRKKHLDLKHIYDYSAVRILVPTLDDCYTALSLVHQRWEHVPKEFDDYISNPKPNGYSSIHTAVIDPDGKNFEIQIRTHDMHERAEHGVAAHWLYKENKAHQSGYETKIAFLRQLLEWHKDVSATDEKSQKEKSTFLDDRVYVFTPAGDIQDLPIGATPLDFAYHIHSGLGNRCRGAKINGHIVPLTHTLQTGDQVEIIAAQQGTPSRDWLNKELGYLKTSRARSKVAHWFKQLDINEHVESGREHLEREFVRAGIHQVNLQKIAYRFKFKDEDAFFAAIGRGALRIAQVLQLIQADQKQAAQTSLPISHEKKHQTFSPSLHIAGTDDLLTRIARCCKPIPGDSIIGFITQGRGVSIHRKDCNNMLHLPPQLDGRMIEVSWDHQKLGSYYVDLQITAHTQGNLLKEIPGLVANLKIDLIALHSTISKKNNMIFVTLTIQIHDLTQLKQLSVQLHQLSNVIGVKRIK
jgi:GTP pyrophosphokinase